MSVEGDTPRQAVGPLTADCVEKVGARNFIARDSSFGIRSAPSLNQFCASASPGASIFLAFPERRLFQHNRPGPTVRLTSIDAFGAGRAAALLAPARPN